METIVQIPEHTRTRELKISDAGKVHQLVVNTLTRLRWRILLHDEQNIVSTTQTHPQMPGEIITVTIDANILSVSSRPANEYYYHESLNERNTAQFITTLDLIIEEDAKAERSKHPMHREKYGALLISRTYVVTPVLVYINALIFLIMTLGGISPIEPTARELFAWGGNFRAATTGGEWWRLGSYMFIHAGFMHFFMNSFALLYVGMYLEPLLGQKRFAAAYLLSGICAGLLSMTMHESVAVGASGAIFGMYGVFLAILSTGYIQKSARRTMLRSMLFFVVYNLMAGLQGNTDNAAHIGGLISGFAIGFAYYPDIAGKVRHSNRLTAILTASVLLLSVTWIFLLR